MKNFLSMFAAVIIAIAFTGALLAAEPAPPAAAVKKTEKKSCDTCIKAGKAKDCACKDCSKCKDCKDCSKCKDSAKCRDCKKGKKCNDCKDGKTCQKCKKGKDCSKVEKSSDCPATGEKGEAKPATAPSTPAPK